MKHDLPNLDALKVFEAAARLLSFSKAADELCITKGAISHQIKKLELEIGTDLFKRQIRQVWLTDAGQQLFQTTQKIFTTLHNDLDKLKKGDVKTITVAVTTYVASRWLSPIVTSFCNDNPDITLQFQHTVNSSSFDIENVDLAVRWGHCLNQTSKTRLKELPMPMYPACNGVLLEKIRQDKNNRNFSNLPLLCEDRTQDLWQEWAKDNYSIQDNPHRIIEDANVRVQAAIDGQGLILADNLMNAELRNGTLQRITDQELTGYGYILMASTKSQSQPTTSALLDWLIKST